MIIKIMQEGLCQGLDLARITEECPNSHHCLWAGRSDLFQIPDFLPRGCPYENCEVVIFRKKFENDSPAFYAEALKLSRFDGVIKTAAAIAIGKKAKKRKLEKLIRRVYDLRTFGGLVALNIYPLLLGAKEIPFLGSVEVEELRNSYCEADTLQTIEKMQDINLDWVKWTESIGANFISDYEQYPRAVIYLVHLFLNGLERQSSLLPDLQKMTKEERERFFAEIIK